MVNDRTRAFRGIYTSKDNKKHNIKVHTFKRLATFGLSISLEKGGYTKVVDEKEKIKEKAMG